MDSIIFDVDGTLWDASVSIANSWHNYIRNVEKLDMDITVDTLVPLFGQTLPEIAAQIFPQYPKEEQIRLVEGCCDAEHEALLLECAPLYEELEETLKVLSAHYPLYIVSNCQAGYIEVFLKTSGLGQYFKGHLCPGDTGNGKGANIRQIVKTYNLSSPVYVGDTIGDYKACLEAEVPFVFASYGFGQVDTPDYVIEKPADLIKLFV